MISWDIDMESIYIICCHPGESRDPGQAIVWIPDQVRDDDEKLDIALDISSD